MSHINNNNNNNNDNNNNNSFHKNNINGGYDEASNNLKNNNFSIKIHITLKKLSPHFAVQNFQNMPLKSAKSIEECIRLKMRNLEFPSIFTNK